MQFLQYLLVEKTDDLSRLDQETLNAIKSNIRKGAQDLKQNWGNALELVHKAYEVEGVERPDPTMKNGWEQYEEMLTYAVSQLAKARGMDADWRMSSAMFHEALTYKTQKFNIQVITPDNVEEYVTEATDITNLLETFDKADYDTNLSVDGDTTIIRYSRFGIFDKTRVKISAI